MSGKKYSIVLTVILVIIIVAIVGLLGYLAYDYISRTSQTNSAQEYVNSFEEQLAKIKEVPKETQTSDNIIDSGDTVDDNNLNTNTEIDTNTQTGKKTNNKKKTTYNGFEVLGTIEIPKTNVKYPVLAKLSAKALDTAVCAIYPRDITLNMIGNVVIAGHNYRNGTFFSNNKKLSVGDKIYITDLDGKKVTYIIYNKFQTDDNDTRSYKKDTKGKREITLSTCTDDAKERIIIEAREQ